METRSLSWMRSSDRAMRIPVTLLSAVLAACLVGCGSTPSLTGPTPVVIGDSITLPPDAITYRRPGTLPAMVNIVVGMGSTDFGFQCYLVSPPDSESLHRCSLDVTLKINTEYWISLLGSDGLTGMPYADDFFIRGQQVTRKTTVCSVRSCVDARAFTIVSGDGTIQ